MITEQLQKKIEAYQDKRDVIVGHMGNVSYSHEWGAMASEAHAITEAIEQMQRELKGKNTADSIVELIRATLEPALDTLDNARKEVREKYPKLFDDDDDDDDDTASPKES